MKIGLLGGVFGTAMGNYALSAPENVLRRYLMDAGHDVMPMSANAMPDFAPKADVYHANHFGLGAYGVLLAGARPFVFTSHDPFLVSDFPVRRSTIDRILQPRVLRTADAVVALSTREAALLRERFELYDDVRIEVIPNGLDLELYGPPAREPPGLEVLTVAQLTEYKGHRYLLYAAAQLAERFPDLRLVFVTNEHGLRPELERTAAELGIAERIAYEGPYATPELVARYQRCSVYVQPSLAECFPVTVLEAMACGRPIVATSVGGVVDELGPAGEIVPPGDAAALAAALESLLSDAGRRNTLGRAALDRCRRLYDGKRIAETHVQLYAELVSGKGRHRPGRVRRSAAATAIAAIRNRSRIVPITPTRRAIDAVRRIRRGARS